MDDLPLPIRLMLGFQAFTGLVMGRASGALEAVAEGPATAAELAERAGLDAHNTTVWLRAMAAAGLAVRDGDRFALGDDLAMTLSPDFPVDFRAALDLYHALFAPPVHAAVDAMSTGTGIGPDLWAPMAPIVGRINTPTWRQALVQDFIAADPELVDRLRAGGAIADVACGNGDAARVMADAFPDSRSTATTRTRRTTPATTGSTCIGRPTCRYRRTSSSPAWTRCTTSATRRPR